MTLVTLPFFHPRHPPFSPPFLPLPYSCSSSPSHQQNLHSAFLKRIFADLVFKFLTFLANGSHVERGNHVQWNGSKLHLLIFNWPLALGGRFGQLTVKWRASDRSSTLPKYTRGGPARKRPNPFWPESVQYKDLSHCTLH